jgi:hypothetical protein
MIMSTLGDWVDDEADGAGADDGSEDRKACSARSDSKVSIESPVEPRGTGSNPHEASFERR